MTNEKTGHVSWKDYVYNLPIGGTTTTVVQQLPDFEVTGIDVFADACSKLTNGTISCTGTAGALPAPRRVDWHVQGTVTLTGFSLVPQTFTADSISSADFSTTGIKGCTNCGGSGGTITNPPVGTAGEEKGGCAQRGICGGGAGTGTVTIVKGDGLLHGVKNVHAIAESLLPDSYITLPLGSGSWFFMNPWTFGVLCLITIIIGIIGLFVILRLLRK